MEEKGEKERWRNAASRSHERRIIVAEKEDDEGAYESEATQRAHVSSHVFRISSAHNARQTRTGHGTARRGTARRGGGLSVLRFSLLHTAQRTQWFAAAMRYILFRKLYLKFSLYLYIFLFLPSREGTFSLSFFYPFYFFIFFLFFFFEKGLTQAYVRDEGIPPRTHAFYFLINMREVVHSAVASSIFDVIIFTAACSCQRLCSRPISLWTALTRSRV